MPNYRAFPRLYLNPIHSVTGILPLVDERWPNIAESVTSVSNFILAKPNIAEDNLLHKCHKRYSNDSLYAGSSLGSWGFESFDYNPSDHLLVARQRPQFHALTPKPTAHSDLHKSISKSGCRRRHLPLIEVRSLRRRSRLQRWDHGCNGRSFSTFSDLLLHQQEGSTVYSKPPFLESRQPLWN